MELICTDRNGFRPVNDREAYALRYTFGVMVGSFLIDIIKIKYDPPLLNESRDGRVISNTEILMQPNYNSKRLDWLGGFIHEAAHIWQRNTGRHRAGKGGEDYDYDYTQLRSLNLKREEHAEAVQDWFNVKYGLEHHLIGAGANQMTFWEIQKPILKALDYHIDYNLSEDDLLLLIEHHYTRLIKEIWDPYHIPSLRVAHHR